MSSPIENSKLHLQKALNSIVVLSLVVLSFSSIDVVRGRVKDSKRLADIRQIKAALDMYSYRHNAFPNVTDNDINGWDTSFEFDGAGGNFLNILVEENFIDQIPFDPVNSNNFYYRYKKFPAGSFGCARPFYILQAVNFEGDRNDHGWGSCPEKDFVSELPNGYTIQVFD